MQQSLFATVPHLFSRHQITKMHSTLHTPPHPAPYTPPHMHLALDIDKTLTPPTICTLGSKNEICDTHQSEWLNLLERVKRDLTTKLSVVSARREDSSLRGCEEKVSGTSGEVTEKVCEMKPKFYMHPSKEEDGRPRSEESVATQKVKHLLTLSDNLPHTVVFVDDNEANCDAARNAGFRVVHIPNGMNSTVSDAIMKELKSGAEQLTAGASQRQSAIQSALLLRRLGSRVVRRQ